VQTDGDDATAANSGFCPVVDHDLTFTVTPRPTIGKKKAKAIAAAASASKKMKVSPLSDSIKMTHNVALERLASAAETKNEVGKRLALAVEAKNGIAKEQVMIQVFLANPQSVASIAFFAAKSAEYSALEVRAVVTTTDVDVPVPVSFDDDVEEEHADLDLRTLPETQKLVGCLLDAAAATTTSLADDVVDGDDEDDDAFNDPTYFNARKWLEKNAPPVIDLTLIRGSDFSDDEKENDGRIPLSIQIKVEEPTDETQWTALDGVM
jgi:hypothetical protein